MKPSLWFVTVAWFLILLWIIVSACLLFGFIGVGVFTSSLPSAGQCMQTLYPFVQTLIITLPALLAAIPPALGLAVYLRYAEGNRGYHWINSFTRIFAGIPGLVMGFASLLWTQAMGGNLRLIASILFFLMAFPRLALLFEHALRKVGDSHTRDALALGGTQRQVLRQITLPLARHSLISAILTIWARMLGWVAPLLFVFAGSNDHLPLQLTIFRSYYEAHPVWMPLLLLLLWIGILYRIRMEIDKRWNLQH